jgi:hypothetical protein
MLHPRECTQLLPANELAYSRNGAEAGLEEKFIHRDELQPHLSFLLLHPLPVLFTFSVSSCSEAFVSLLPSNMLMLALLLGLASHAAANCGYGTSLYPRLPNVKVSTFGYDGLSGPLNWYGLNKSNSACDTGKTQSPIVINSSISCVTGDSVQWQVPDYPQGAEFENLGTNVEVVVNGTLQDPSSGITYKLAQFHFHTPAEHRVEDEYYFGEMHWVFESAGMLNPRITRK